jgi:hypothetical protein
LPKAKKEILGFSATKQANIDENGTRTHAPCGTRNIEQVFDAKEGP